MYYKLKDGSIVGEEALEHAFWVTNGYVREKDEFAYICWRDRLIGSGAITKVYEPLKLSESDNVFNFLTGCLGMDE